MPTVLGNGQYAWTVGNLTFQVDPNVGARITTFSLNGVNMLTGPSVNPTYWGSTFWTSPESQWGQPPPVEIDSSPYTVMMSGGVVTMTGTKSAKLLVHIVKTFSVDTNGVVHIQYAIANDSAATVHMAPWEVTRAPAGGSLGGLTFFPSAAGAKMMLSTGATLPLMNQGGVTWSLYNQAAVTSASKLYADGQEGWLAHADQGLVFIMQFPAILPAQDAPNEGNIELFVNAPATVGQRYVEMEAQGAYQMIAPGMMLPWWNVNWYLKPMPSGATATVGDAALLAFVRSSLQ
jgi:hypothetical protein